LVNKFIHLQMRWTAGPASRRRGSGRLPVLDQCARTTLECTLSGGLCCGL